MSVDSRIEAQSGRGFWQENGGKKIVSKQYFLAPFFLAMIGGCELCLSRDGVEGYALHIDIDPVGRFQWT